MSNTKQMALTLGSAALKIGALVGVGYGALRLLEKKQAVPEPEQEK